MIIILFLIVLIVMVMVMVMVIVMMMVRVAQHERLADRSPIIVMTMTDTRKTVKVFILIFLNIKE